MASEHEIKTYIIGEFVPEVTVDELDADYDLLENGVIDSLGLLQLIEWVGTRFELPVSDMDLSPANFQSVNAIREFIRTA